MNLASECDKAVNLKDIIGEINDNFAKSLGNSLTPLVDRMNSIEDSYRAISEILRKVPEFRDLVSENEELKKELAEFKNSYVEYPSVTLKVTEKERDIENTNDIVEQVYTDANLQPYGSSAGALVRSDGLYNTNDDSSEDDDDDDDDDGDDDGDDDAVQSDYILHNSDSSNANEDDSNDGSGKQITAGSTSSVVDSNSANSDAVSDSDNENGSNDDTNEEVYVIEIHNKGTFYTDDELNGIIYTIEDDDEIGEKVGIFSDGIEVFD
jgi:hypothetical protein